MQHDYCGHPNLLKHLLSYTHWKDFLLKLPDEAARGLQVLATNPKSSDSYSLLRRFFDTDYFLETLPDQFWRKKNGQIPTYGEFFLKHYIELSQIRGFSSFSRFVTSRIGARSTTDPSKIEWAIPYNVDHPRMAKMKLLDMFAIGELKRSEDLDFDAPGAIRTLKPRIELKEAVKGWIFGDESQLLVSFLRKNQWADEFRFGNFSFDKSLNNRSGNSLLEKARLAEQALQEGSLRGITFHIVGGTSIHPSVLGNLIRQVPDLRVVHYNSLLDIKNENGQIVVDQRDGKSILDAA